jgi:MATE family multidrug resistance protein
MKHETKKIIKRILIIAFPMVISQATDSIMMFVDRLFLSRLGAEYLSAGMSGGLTMFMVSSLFIGTVSYANALVAQLYGAERKGKCGIAVFQALLIAVLCYPVIIAVSPLIRYLFVFAGQEELQAALSYEYFQTLVFGSLFLILRFAISGFFLGIGRTKVVMIANLIGMIVNIPANYLFIFGKLGFPALGLQGAALGTIMGNATAFILLLLFFLRPSNRAEFGTHRSFRFHRGFFKTLLTFGIPAGIEMLLNTAAFNVFVQFMHSYGAKVAAAVTITFNWDIMAFVPMLGMGYATTALVGQNIGARNPEQAKLTAFMSLRLGWIYSGTMVLLFLAAAPALVRVFASGFSGNTGEISGLAVTLLRLASLYILADAAQLVFAGALRGAGDTRWVMWTSVILHWFFSIITVILIRVVKADPVTVWICFIAFIIALGIAMFLRFRGGKWRNIRLIKKEEASTIP